MLLRYHKPDINILGCYIVKKNAEAEHDKKVCQTLELKRNTLLSKAEKECPALQEVPLPILPHDL